MPLSPVPPAALLQMPTYALSLLGREAHDRMAAALPTGLRLGHLAVLGALSDQAARSQRVLADALRIHPSDIVAIVDELSARALVTRETDPADRRRKRVALTRAGQQLLTQATRDSKHISRELLAGLDRDQRRTVEELLRRALTRADQG